ncbi:MAG: ankyrin repeat domain-containing protein [Acidobacteriia bacterium]|nr:ankyrin repeat domain-containing protein [Terriglobia bacterium]
MHKGIAIHEAYVRGDLETLKKLLGNPPNFPNCRGPRGVGEIILEYAICWSPLPFIRTLLELGANPNYGDHAGFPSLIAALSTQREDKSEIVELLLSFGADIQQRGVNGYTPLHYAAALNDAPLVELLLAHRADPNARTDVDDYTTPLEEAERAGHRETVRILKRF